MLKTDFMVIGLRQREASLEGEKSVSLFHTELKRAQSVKCLGANIDEYLSIHILSIRQKVTRNLSILKKRVKPVLKVENLIDIFRSIIEP